MNVLCIAGFLGSGKTTVLLEVARAMVERGEQLAIIENEIGEVGVDGGYVREQGLPVQELFGGCICCTLQVGLVETLRTVEGRYEPDWVIIEPTGLAAPGDILGLVVDNCPHVDTIRVLTLVDAPRWPMLLEIVEPLVTAQLEAADVVAVNKVDEVDEEALDGGHRASVRDARRHGDRPARVRHLRRGHEAPAGRGAVTRAAPARADGTGTAGTTTCATCPRTPRPRSSRRGRTSVFAPPAQADQLELTCHPILGGALGRPGRRRLRAGRPHQGHARGARPRRPRLPRHGPRSAAPALTGGVAGAPEHAVLTINVIVFGVDEVALPAIVTRRLVPRAGARDRLARAEPASSRRRRRRRALAVPRRRPAPSRPSSPQARPTCVAPRPKGLTSRTCGRPG